MSVQKITNGIPNGVNKDCVRKKKINQFGDYEDTTHMSCEDWSSRWAKDQTQFHMKQVHPMLQKHISTLTEGKSKLRMYVPLCGKSCDLKWLAEAGHKVVGSECSTKGCEEFFEENKIPYTKEICREVNGTLYKSTDAEKCISIYNCDYFKLISAVVGQFDCIWDRGSFVAIPVDQRQKYADVITRMMRNNTRYLIDCFLVDNTHFGGPPFNCEESDVISHFGKTCKVEKIDEKDAFGKWQKETWGVSYFTEEVYFMKLR